jgi:hypothetical protein
MFSIYIFFKNTAEIHSIQQKICVAHPKSMRHGYGGLTPQALVLAGAHLCVAHPFFGAPYIRRYLWSIYLGAPRLLICGAPKRSAPQIMGPWIRVFLVVIATIYTAGAVAPASTDVFVGHGVGLAPLVKS